MLPISVIGILHGCIPSGQNTPLSPAMYYDCKAVQAHLHQDRPPLARNEFLHFLPTLPPPRCPPASRRPAELVIRLLFTRRARRQGGEGG